MSKYNFHKILVYYEEYNFINAQEIILILKAKAYKFLSMPCNKQKLKSEFQKKEI